MKKVIYGIALAFGLTIVAGATTHVQAQTSNVTVKEKTGWSHRKKGAVIGAGAGAVTGALVSKHHAKGAIIGGAVGAGAGYLYGRHHDKKDPAYANRKIYKYKKD